MHSETGSHRIPGTNKGRVISCDKRALVPYQGIPILEDRANLIAPSARLRQ